MTHNSAFCQKSGLDWLQMANFGHFAVFFHLFPQNEAQIDSKWPISPNSQLFPSFATKASHFWRNLKSFCFCLGGGGAPFRGSTTWTILKDYLRNKLLIRKTRSFIIYLYITSYHKTIRPDPKFITIPRTVYRT